MSKKKVGVSPTTPRPESDISSKLARLQKSSPIRKISKVSSKKIQKKSVRSSSSRDIGRKLIDDRFDCLYGFVLLPEEMKIWVRNQIDEKASKSRYTANIKRELLELRINELLTPYQSLSDYLGNLTHSAVAKLILKKLWNEPCRAKDIIDFFDIRVLEDFSNRKRWLYGFLATLVKYNLIDVRVIGDRETDKIPDTTIRMPKLFYVVGRHTESTTEELVLQFVRRDARQYPKKKKEKAEKKEKLVQLTFCSICECDLTNIEFYYIDRKKVCITCFKQKKHTYGSD